MKIPKPLTRDLRVYAFDPALGMRLETLDSNEAVLEIPWEDVEPGPIGEYLEVVDVDPVSKYAYAPVDLNHPYVLAQRGLPPSDDNPQFHQQMVYAVAMRTIQHFERALGRRALWAEVPGETEKEEWRFVRRLRVYPHALREANAYYSPERRPYTLLIDCGIHLAEEDGSGRIQTVVQDILSETDGVIDLLVATHEHWDHISGFKQAQELFLENFQVGALWTAWTENGKNRVARRLIDKRSPAIRAVGRAGEALQSLNGSASHPLIGLVGFLGDTTGKNLDAAKVLEKLGDNSRKITYHTPGEPPFELPGVDARVYVLGPPRNPELIRRDQPSKGGDEVYLTSFALHLDAVESGLDAAGSSPFDRSLAIPLAATKRIDFFERHYWAPETSDTPREREEREQAWRRIDTAWLDSAAHLALKFDEDTNNTSLVLAIELGPVGGPVLLFAADAQVRNRLSWQNVVWENVGGKRVTGPDLLRRTVIYKVGHHASHNATSKKQGLEMMDALELALVPTDADVAYKGIRSRVVLSA